MADYAQRAWAYDIESYERLKNIRSGLHNPNSKAAEFCDRRLAEIEAKYPQYLKRSASSSQEADR